MKMPVNILFLQSNHFKNFWNGIIPNKIPDSFLQFNIPQVRIVREMDKVSQFRKSLAR